MPQNTNDDRNTTGGTFRPHSTTADNTPMEVIWIYSIDPNTALDAVSVAQLGDVNEQK